MLRDSNSYRRFRSAVTIEHIHNLRQFLLMLLTISFRTQQTELLPCKGNENDCPLRLRSRQGQHAGRFHHRGNTRTAIDATCTNIIGIQVSADNDLFVRILASTDRSHYVVVFNRSEFEVVTDVELQQEIFPPFFYHLGDNIELVPVEFDIGYFRQVIKRHAVNHLPVIKRTNGYFG